MAATGPSAAVAESAHYLAHGGTIEPAWRQYPRPDTTGQSRH